MTGPFPSPPHEPASTPRERARWDSVLLRKLSNVAPVAVAYGSFQAVWSALPPSLSYASVHYLLAVATGLMVGLGTLCALLWVRRPQTTNVPVVTTGPRSGPEQSSVISLPPIFDLCYRALVDSVVRFDDRKAGELTGWPHFFHEAQSRERPTAYGTAYGLKLAALLGNQDGRLDRGALVDTLWKLRRPDGGWASRTQGQIGRPEVTAFVLGSLASAGCDPRRFTQAADVLDSMLEPGKDTEVRRRTYLAATVLRELVRVRPGSARLEEFKAVLLTGAVQDPQHENLLCWSSRLDTSRSPSTVHTALAVVALARARKIGGDDKRLHLALEQATQWLVHNRVLENKTEQIRRTLPRDRTEALTVCLFTSAWVVKALTAAGVDSDQETIETLDEAVTLILRAQVKGTWAWDDGNQPLWMSYQGVSALEAYALSRWSP